MGTYLSAPVKEKCEESGESLHCPVVPVAWGVVDMQGWRKTMEDAHVAVTDVPHPIDATRTDDAKIFGVFDGHGGPEVARFCALYLVSVLQQQPTWNNSSTDIIKTDSTDVKEGIHEEAYSNKENAKHTSMGKALVSAFHALDRMIDDPSRRDELVRLRAIKPTLGTQKEAATIPPEVPSSAAVALADKMSESHDDEDVDKTDSATNDHSVFKNEQQREEDSPMDETDSNAMVLDHLVDHVPDDETLQMQQQLEQMSDNEGPQNQEKDEQQSGDSQSEDTDSDVAVGMDEAAELDQDMMSDEDDSDVAEEINTSSIDTDTNDATGDCAADGTTSVKVTSMFQRLLNMNVTAAAGQAVFSLSPSSTHQQDGTTPNTTPEPFRASLVQNGRMICNLPDHPIHAGATAIVAVVVGRTLTVANAGDSRAVLCRAGTAIALSFDHKPTQERELKRINNAGGFVNAFGRVNGNLNLSRSLGDLKYKQVPGLPPAEQMITAEPDVLQYELDASDEFIILGCDGIWDCLTNEQAVEYVRFRIQDKTPTEIGVEMLDEIISIDPRVTQGIGGDNMTIMIVDLQPQSRSYRKIGAQEQQIEDSPVDEE